VTLGRRQIFRPDPGPGPFRHEKGRFSGSGPAPFTRPAVSNTYRYVGDSEKHRRLQENIKKASEYLKRGGVVAAASETFFGLLADIEKHKAVAHIRKIQKLDPGAPLLVVAPGIENVKKLCETWSARAQELAEAYWPGPLTLIVRARTSFPTYLIGPYNTIAIRVPGPCDLSDILTDYGLPLTATSCNRHNEAPAVTSRQVLDIFEKRIDFVVPGASPGGLPSTIVDTTVDPPVVRRRGIVNVEGRFLRK
jgi:L-threonylcarbamoyladenylate synthase